VTVDGAVPSTSKRTARGSPLAMLCLIGTALILSMTTWFSATAILPELARTFGLSAAAASWLTNAVQIGFVVGALSLSISGLVDTLPTRGLMAAAALLAALSNGALLWVPDAAGLFAARFVTGVALAGVYPPALKLIATWFVRGRGLAMGAAVGALTLGSSGPYLLRAIGAHVDWHAVVAVSSSLALLAALLLFFAADGPHAAARPKPDLRRIGIVLRDPGLALANLGYFGHMWELYAMWGWFLAYASDAARVASLPLSASLLTFLVIAVGAGGCLAGGLLADRVGRTATTALMMALSGTCALTIGFAFDGPSWLFIGIALVWGVSVIADSAQFSAMVSELADVQSVGAALALQVAVGFALTVVSIRLTPLLADAVGWRWTFVMLAPGPFVGAAAMLALRRLPRAAEIANGRR
jgi:predicted MFS family arabinose efflux permease